jgi:capsular polysaccharide transport system permease protein
MNDDKFNSKTVNAETNIDGSNEILNRYNLLLKTSKKRAIRIKLLEDQIAKLKEERKKSSETKTEEMLNKKIRPFSLMFDNIKKINLRLMVLILIILVPAFLVFAYSLLFYDSMYISSSTFTIKSNSTDQSIETPSPLTFLGGGDNMDLNTASAYIQSLDMFYILDRKLSLINHYSDHDIVSSLSDNPTQSEIADYWNSIIEVNIDSESSLMQLHVRAFSPEFSQKLSQSILDELDSFINGMNEKMTLDSIRSARVEVDKAKKNIDNISEKIRIFRDQNTFIDPSSEASNILGIISNLENLITQAKAELAQKRAYLREDSVDIISLKTKISSLDQEVSSLRSRIALRDTNAVSNESHDFANVLTRTLSEFEQLNLEYQFAQKILESSLNNLESARQLSLNKSKYLITIDKPKIPDESLWPRPFVATVVTFVLSIFVLSALSLLIAAIKDHFGI